MILYVITRVQNQIYCKSFSNRLKHPHPLLIGHFHYTQANAIQACAPLVPCGKYKKPLTNPPHRPRKDRVPKNLFRIPEYVAPQKYLQIFNSSWKTGTLPPRWKYSKNALIAIPSKPFTSKNLRHVSLTSCVGELVCTDCRGV